MSAGPNKPDALLLLINLFNAISHPSPKLNQRLVVLACFLPVLPVASIALFILHLVALKRRGGERFYLFKRVKREGGNYVVGARQPLLTLLGMSTFATLGSATLGGYRLLENLAYGISHLFISLSCFWTLWFGLVWALSASNAQTWILIRGNARHTPSAFVANTLFLFGLVVGVAVLIGLLAFEAVTATSFFEGRGAFLTEILEGDLSALIAGGPKLEAYFDQAIHLFDTLKDLQIVYSLSPLPILLMNVSTLALWLIIRRRRREAEQLNRDGEHGITSHQGNDQTMKGIEQMFLIDAIAVTTWAAGTLVSSAWSCYAFAKLLSSQSSVNLELIFFLPAWVTVVPLALALVCQVFVAWRSLPQPALTDAERSVAYLSFPARASGAQQSEVRTPKLTTTPKMGNEKGQIVGKREVELELGEDVDDSSGDDRTV